MALILFALGAYSASLVRDDYRDGKAQLVFDRFRPITLIFDRQADAVFFWSMTAVNVGVIAALLLGGGVLIAGTLMGVP